MLVLGAAFLLGGCLPSELAETQAAAASSCGHTQGVVLILRAHRNAPAPRLDQSLMCQVTAAIRGGAPVQLVVASGQPKLITPQLISVSGGTLAEQGSPRVQENLQRINTAITTARPDSPGVDDLAALSVAADAARATGSPHAELVLIDSGLDDRGALDFTVPGMVAADPSDVASQLKASSNLPDLRGFRVFLVGTGYTSPPQAPLSAKWRTNVTQIWRTVVTFAGANVEIVPHPAQGPSVRTDQPVELVPVPSDHSVKIATRTPIVFTGESPVRFEPDSTDFVDPAAALQALTPIAKWLAADPSRKASLVGTTADVDTMTAQIALSQQRADHVRGELVALGAGLAQISTQGVGSNFPQFIPDRDSSGTLLAGPATLNRSVRITLSGD
jgi:outer membrane protein OmpA-like peptidoglycan-associated protein